jgi:hypothetical protein
MSKYALPKLMQVMSNIRSKYDVDITECFLVIKVDAC